MTDLKQADRKRKSAHFWGALWAYVAFAFFIGCGQLIWGQSATAIDGTVFDASQAVISGATVTLTNLDTGVTQTTKSNSAGIFLFTSLSPGRYKVLVTAPTFASWEQQNITLAVGQNLTLLPQLKAGSESVKVEVTSAPPAIDTSSSNLSAIVNSEQIVQLPLNGRNVIELVSLAPGVVTTGTGGQFGAQQTVYAPSGGRDIDVNYTLDGGYNLNTFFSIPNPYPNPDAVREFSVDSRNYDARFGQGSTDVSAVTRSGTNTLHGSAFEFLRNTAFDSRPYFATSVPNYRRNQFGGTIGGPIKRDRLFFFLGYQGTEQSGDPGLATYTTISMQERTGDFSDVSKPIINPSTHNPYPGNIIPSGDISPQAKLFFQKYLPAPNRGTNIYQFPSTATLSEHQGIVRIDYQATSKNSIFARYFLDDIPQVAFGGGTASALDARWLTDEPTRFQNITIGDVHVFRNNFINDFHFTYDRSAFGLYPRLDFSLPGLGYPVHIGNAVSQYGLSPQSAINLSGVFNANTGAPTRDAIATTQFTDTVTWVKGIHRFAFGFEVYRNRINETQNYNTAGSLSFNGQATGTAASDFMLGQFSTYTQVAGLVSHLHQILPSFYVQDDIKLTRRLTLQAGIRWDIASGYHSENGQLLTLIPGRQSTVFPLATPGLLFAGDPGIPADIVGTRWNNIAPRIGLAWDVHGNGKTSLRAGFGTYYTPMKEGITLNRLTLIQPYTLQVTISGGDASNIFARPPYNGVDPFPRPPVTDHDELAKLPFLETAGEASVAKDTKTQTNYEWSLSLQQQLWSHTMLETDYVGTVGNHLIGSVESNPARYIPGQSTVSNTQSRRLYPAIGNINSVVGIFNSNYHALEVTVRQQPARGVTMNASYTWSKLLGVTSSEGAGNNGPRNPFNYRMDYGPLASDRKHNFVMSIIWTPSPIKASSTAPVRYLIQGWQLSGIVHLTSGAPLNLLSGVDNSFSAIGGDTPDVVGNWRLSGGRSKTEQIGAWFNKDAFVRNAVGTFGQLSLGTLRNPGSETVDLNIQKNFAITERYHGQFRSSLYNAFNHTNLGGAVGTLTSANFGKIQTAGSPRVIELGLRFEF